MATGTDTFTGVDATNLTAHTSDSAHTWTQPIGSGSLVLLNNEVTGGTAGQEARLLWSFVADSTDLDVTATMDFLSTAGAALIGFVVCMNTAGTQGVQVTLNQFSSQLTVTDVAGETGLRATGWTAADHVIKAERRGGTLTILVDGVAPGGWSPIDVSGYAGNRVGLYGYSSVDPSEFYRINQLQAADVTAGTPPVNVTPPVITGTPADGQTLTCTSDMEDDWEPDATSLAYQWRRRAV